MHETGIEGYFVARGGKKLRCGYTTGTCAAAAAKAAAMMLLSSRPVYEVELTVPKGIKLSLETEDISMPGQQSPDRGLKGTEGASCAVRKYAGDDPDITDGILVYASVSKRDEEGILVDGGTGVGRVTRSGMSCSPGEAAINPVPRAMIAEAVREVMDEFDYSGGLSVIISVPEGVNIAEHTFNPRLGIEGGISILGTSGIVTPMSSQALIDSIKLEMSMKKSSGYNEIAVSPGNYGETFLKEETALDPDRFVKCSNFVGETVDMAVELGFESLLFVAHIGKFIKVAGGIMNTHSSEADCRSELMASFALRAGADRETAMQLLSCAVTDEGLIILKEKGLLEETVKLIIESIRKNLQRRCKGVLKTEAVLFSGSCGYLGQSEGAAQLIKRLERKE